jgi:hypothetical protein
MATPNKKTRKSSTTSSLDSADTELISKIVSNLEKFLKRKNDENSTLANQIAEYRRILQLDGNYNILVHRVPGPATIEEITVKFKKKKNIFFRKLIIFFEILESLSSVRPDYRRNGKCKRWIKIRFCYVYIT